MESLINGVPVLGWPVGGEQFFNAKVMEEELGVCVEMMEIVMGEPEKGEEMRRKVWKVREMMRTAMEEEEGGKGGSSLELSATL